ncbi:MAG: ATP-binding protein [Xanthomonadales bacterium]|jgi:anti-sigma regulatory factor (Ser/Thr protein kinase)|nr:ATP-binding protein [Xanthomonadales bacterium]
MSEAHVQSIGTSRQAISSFADDFADWASQHGVPEPSVRAFQVAFDELLTNALDYGLAGQADAMLEVRLYPSAHALDAQIIDNGPAFDPLSEAALPDLDLLVEDRPIGGLGVHLVKSLMDRAEYERRGDHNVLSLHKRHPSVTATARDDLTG